MLWQTKYELPPVAVGTSEPEVGVGFESPCADVVVAVRLWGAALSVVSTPSTVVRIGVIVATGVPLASTETQGSRADSVTEGALAAGFGRASMDRVF